MKSCAVKKKVKRIIIKFEGIKMKAFDIPKFRGYLADKYSKFTLIHNHLSNNKFRYAYPVIQFKLIDQVPIILAIGQGIEILKKVFFELDRLKINGREMIINEKSVVLNEVDFGQTEEPRLYQFLSPWMALNQENYERFKSLLWKEQRTFLEALLKGNLKSLSKGFDYFIPDFENICVEANLKSVLRNFKNIKMICFTGTFKTNFYIPDYLGIGKQTARGFGVVGERK
ncbi:MAG: hypothetical protein DRP78_04715 [Candidatus Omnitrophota bacterium]|nr:MAG: hypothetical protein DRP78_04715 [Candidatus Omnitrophota bacterium]